MTIMRDGHFKKFDAATLVNEEKGRRGGGREEETW